MGTEVERHQRPAIRVDQAASQVEDKLARDAQLLSQVRDSVIVTDLNGIVTYWNEGATRLYGWRADEMLGRSIVDRVPEAVRAKTAAALAAVRDGHDFFGEWQDFHKEGSQIWVDASVTRVLDAAGNPVGVIGVAHDITQWKQMEERLRGSESRLNEAQQVAHIGSWNCDISSNTITWSDEHYRIYGLQPQQMAMTSDEILGRIHPDDRERVLGEVNRAIRDRQPYEVCFQAIRPDGTTRFVHSRGQVVYGDRGQPTRIFGTTQDITEQKQIEDRLRRNESLLAEAQELTHIGSWNWDITTNATTWSDEHYRIYGLRPQEMVMTYDLFLSFVHPDDRATVNQLVDVAIESHQPYDYCFRVVHRDGTVRITHSRGVVVYDEFDRPVRMFGTAQDITERRQAEDALRDYAQRLQIVSRRVIEIQEEERGHLARELHDEIGQVLSAVSVNLQSVKGVAPAESWARLDESIQVVDQAIQQVRNLSLDLRPPILDHLGLTATLRWYADRQAQRAGFVLHIHTETSGERLPDAVRIGCYRVAQEALTNIVRHAQAKAVWIDFHRSDDAVKMSIRDDGIGFDPIAAHRQARRGASFGILGMRERIELLGGRFELESAPGQGTTVRIALSLGQE